VVPAPREVRGNLRPGIAARVGEQEIEVALVKRVAGAQGIAPAEARDRLIGDALLAEHGRTELAPSGIVPVAERAALARALLERLSSEERAAGEPSDRELQAIAEARWAELDRPPAARTSHAVVLVQEGTDKRAAKALAERIAEAVRGITDAERFRERAKAVPADGLEVRVESLAPVTADGRVVPQRPTAGPPARFDAAFAAAANAIGDVGGHSPVTESAFGFHVILLEERLPEQRVAAERRRQLLRDEALAVRMRRREQELVERLLRSTRVTHDRAAGALTAEIRVRP
jgi:hypothetical protein